jgi:DNA-binding FrmR family transcriptional regulator
MRREEIGRRLKRVEGQIRGLQRMVEEKRECEAILTQLIAARAALDRVGLLVVENYVEECLVISDEQVAKEQVRNVLRLVFSRYSLPEPNDASVRDSDQNQPANPIQDVAVASAEEE